LGLQFYGPVRILSCFLRIIKVIIGKSTNVISCWILRVQFNDLMTILSCLPHIPKFFVRKCAFAKIRGPSVDGDHYGRSLDNRVNFLSL
jgi:hypothetical protein